MDKNYRTRAIIIVAIIAVICVVLNIIFCVLSIQSLSEEYFKVAEESFDNVKKQLHQEFKTADDFLKRDDELIAVDRQLEVILNTNLNTAERDLDGLSPQQLQESINARYAIFNFLDSMRGFSSISFINENLSGTVFSPAYSETEGWLTRKTGTLNQKVAEKLAGLEDGEIYNSIDAHKEIMVSDNEDVVYFAAKKIESGYVVLTKNMDYVFSNLIDPGFNSIVLIIKGEGGVLWTTQSINHPIRKDGFLSMLTNNVRIRLNTDESAFTVSTTYGTDAKQSVIFTVMGKDGEDYNFIRIAAYVSADSQRQYINKGIIQQVIESAAILVTWMVGAVSLVILLKSVGNNKPFQHSRNNFMLEFTKKGQIIWMNHNFKREYGTPENIQTIETGGFAGKMNEGKSVVFTLLDSYGTQRHLLMHSLYYSGFIRLVGSDMTEVINEYRKLKDADIYDSLTRLPIERVFVQRVEEIFVANGKVDGMLAMLKLTNMPVLKVMLGENSFNQLVALGADFVRKILEPYGELYYMRSGNFLLFVDNHERGEKISADMPSIMEKLNVPMTFLDNKVKLEARMGVVTLDAEDGEEEEGREVTADSLISNAQASLENAIESKTGYYIMHPSNFAALRTNFTAADVIQKMIQNNEIETYFQPQLCLKTNKIVGFESLCRVAGHKAREITSAELIAIAEQYGGMIGLGNFVYGKALAFAQEVQDRGIKVSVNVSPIQLIQEGFTDNFLKSHKRYGIKNGMFNIEVTEGIALYSFGHISDKLKLLQSSGINIHMDDFGVAYSSLTHVKKLPISTIKIDKGLIDDIAESKNAKALVRNVIALSKDLGCEVVAEGVETQEQVDVLKELNCDIIQGYYIGKAVTYQAALEKIKEFNKD